jgi:hypothetical protein
LCIAQSGILGNYAGARPFPAGIGNYLLVVQEQAKFNRPEKNENQWNYHNGKLYQCRSTLFTQLFFVFRHGS